MLPPGGPVTPADDHLRAQVVQHQQRADAVGVRNALVQQPLELAVHAARVLLGRRRLVQHRPDALARMVPQQHRQQLVAIEPIGLGPPGAPVDLDAGRVHHDVVDTLLTQPAVQPPAVTTRFVATVHRCARRQPATSPRLTDASQHLGLRAGTHRVPARTATAAAQRQRPALVAQFKTQVQISCRLSYRCREGLSRVTSFPYSLAKGLETPL